MGIADELLGRTLRGRGRQSRDWQVYEKVENRSERTPGLFSVAYKCRDEHGRNAFLKASDLSKVFHANPDDQLGTVLRASQAHQFERDILAYCHGNRMDRVVTALDYGNESIVHNGVMDLLVFLVFELADGDLRSRVRKPADFDLLWIVNALHEYAVAVQQLHKGDVYHNDIKPSNALIFTAGARKIADLGRATTPRMVAVHDNEQCAGDLRFAAPEQIYAMDKPLPADRRYAFQRAGDIYNLGSLAHYLLTGTSVTQGVTIRLRPEHRPPSDTGGWTDGISLVMPFWRAAFEQLLQELADVASEQWSRVALDELGFLTKMIRELCEPDWVSRGNPKSASSGNGYDLARYVSRLDLGRSRLMVTRH